MAAEQHTEEYPVFMLPFLLLVPALLTAGCEPGPATGPATDPPTEATHELHSHFRVSRLSDSVTITEVTDIQFLSDGHLVVDHAITSRRLLELDASGGLKEVIGEAGREEGQFADITRFVVTPDDSLHVFDERLTRQQVFGRTGSGWELARALDAERNLSDLFIADYPLAVYPSPRSGYRTLFVNDFFYSDTTHRFYRFLSETGYNLDYTGRRRLLRPVQDAVLTRTGRDLSVDWSGRYFAAFYRYRPATGEVLYISNTSSEIRWLEWEGAERVSGHLPHERVPLNREAVERYLERISDSYTEERVARIRSLYMDEEPLFRQLFLDGDRLWVRLTRSDPEHPDWLVTDLRGRVQAAFHHPGDFEAMAVREGILYGMLTVEEEPFLAAFRAVSLSSGE